MPERGSGLKTRRTTNRSRPPDTPRADVPDEVMMPLLDRIVRQSLDEDYQVVARRKDAERAARRRARRGRGPRPRALQRPRRPPPPAGRPRRVAAAVMAVFGVLVAIAAVQTARNAPEASAGRASLVSQIQDRHATVTRLQGKLDRLQTATNDLRSGNSQATEDEQALTARVQRLQVRTGFGAVTGPGVRITVNDAPEGDVTQVVRDSD